MPDSPTHPPSEFCGPTEAAAYTGFSVTHLERLRAEHSGPRFYRVGRSIRYTYADLRAWMTANPSTMPVLDPSQPREEPEPL